MVTDGKGGPVGGVTQVIEMGLAFICGRRDEQSAPHFRGHQTLGIAQ